MNITLQDVPGAISCQKILDEAGKMIGAVHFYERRPPRFSPGFLGSAELQALADLMKRLEKTEAAIQAAKK